jgi:cytochrome c556
MKRIIISIVVLSGLVFGQEHFQLDRMKNMQEMETALSTIQKGFLFNNINVVKNGVKDIKNTAMHTESFIKEGVTKEGLNTLVYAKKQAKDIMELADKIEVSFAKGDRYNAAGDYLRILSKCLSCHQTVRSW